MLRRKPKQEGALALAIEAIAGVNLQMQMFIAELSDLIDEAALRDPGRAITIVPNFTVTFSFAGKSISSSVESRPEKRMGVRQFPSCLQQVAGRLKAATSDGCDQNRHHRFVIH
jgi:hypothetical protein